MVASLVSPPSFATLVLSLMVTSAGAQPNAGGPAPLTRDELRACMSNGEVLERRSQVLQTGLRASNEEAAAISVENAKLLRVSAEGLQDRAAREAYQARSKALEQRVLRYNQRTKEFKLAMADLNADQAAYLRGCGGRTYLQSDRDAILTERLAPQPAASAASPGASTTQ